MAVRNADNAQIADSTGEQTNPTAAGSALADTTALEAGIYEARVTLSATAAAQFSFQHRNAANDANATDASVIYIPANSSAQYLFEYFVNDGDRLRVMMDTDLTGVAAAHISAKRVG